MDAEGCLHEQSWPGLNLMHSTQLPHTRTHAACGHAMPADGCMHAKGAIMLHSPQHQVPGHLQRVVGIDVCKAALEHLVAGAGQPTCRARIHVSKNDRFILAALDMPRLVPHGLPAGHQPETLRAVVDGLSPPAECICSMTTCEHNWLPSQEYHLEHLAAARSWQADIWPVLDTCRVQLLGSSVSIKPGTCLSSCLEAPLG